jgi:hypothetical protein
LGEEESDAVQTITRLFPRISSIIAKEDFFKKKRPRAMERLIPPTLPISSSPPVEASLETLRKAISSFTPGSSRGADGLRPQHLKDLIGKDRGMQGENLLNALV